jgi:hypothetical protein
MELPTRVAGLGKLNSLDDDYELALENELSMKTVDDNISRRLSPE